MLYLYAVAYLAAGMHLLALRGKRPHPRWHQNWSWDNSIHGLPEDEAQEAALKDIFEAEDVTGIAILIPQHVLVADVDTEEAGALYMQLAKEYPDTPVAQTAHGLHIWFWAPGADASVWAGGRTLLFKGFGGYVVAPPSAHFTDDTLTEQDAVYTWITPLIEEGVAHIGPLDVLPEAMQEAIEFGRQFEAARADPLSMWVIRYEKTETGWRLWKEPALDGLCKAIREAPDGNQNNVIAWAAMRAEEEGVSYEDAMKHLYTAAVEGGHPARRAKTTIDGVYKRRGRSRA